MDWLEAAEACQLDALRTSCLLRLAHSLAGWGDSLAASLAHASLLERCDKRTLTQLLGIMTAAGKRRTGDQPLADAIPSAAKVDNSRAEAANPATFSWTLERFSERPFGVGDRILRRAQLAAARVSRRHYTRA
ncbi:DNA primase [Chlorella sorokiniana]|uniref:DNA primase n=1 Tax=Chlorella sorokiniana TaxID=3076 RepID=A0A2P6TUH7_CHLSO|nr:DNA primase [Chlorella sorokiniana]|eukprot:PRW57719.1 DNA primase [Chlorella sorokiniana]